MEYRSHRRKSLMECSISSGVRGELSLKVKYYEEAQQQTYGVDALGDGNFELLSHPLVPIYHALGSL